MKRALLSAVALMLLLSACGVAAAPTPPPIETASVSTTPEPTVTPTPEPAAETRGLSPFASVVFLHLKAARDRWEDDDENMIRETLEYYFLLKNDVEFVPGYAVPDFAPFFDESSPDYDDLVFDVDKARYYRLLADVSDSPGLAWYNTFVRFNSIEIDGDTARVEAYNLRYFVYEGIRTHSVAGTTYYVELRKVDGVWLISGITAADSFHEMTHAELLEEIARLEQELV